MRGMQVVATLAMSTVVLGQPQRPARNPIPPGKGVIAGRVLEAGSQRPISGATVRLSPRGTYGTWAPGIDADPNRQVKTGIDGVFRFSDVGPIEYNLTATRSGYIEGGFGKTWARGTHAPMLIGQDQSVNGIEVLLWPVGELTGRVLDERGQPVAGVSVRASNPDVTDSQDFNRYVGGGQTDANGEYRFAVQPPARAIVCVDAYYTTYAIPPLSAAQRRVPEGPPPTGPMGLAPSTLVSPDGRHFVQFSLVPPPPGPGGESEAYVSSCAPTATSTDDAAVIELKAGTTSAPDLILQPRRSIRISGRLLGPAGPLGQTWLRLVPTVEESAIAPRLSQALTALDGTFAFLIVPVGAYRWEVDVPNPPPTVTPSAIGSPTPSTPVPAISKI